MNVKKTAQAIKMIETIAIKVITHPKFNLNNLDCFACLISVKPSFEFVLTLAPLVIKKILAP
ncbi:MAG: hypothetical protein MJ201_05135 [Mycoplasmoidaceae bacterium]|nr:hypothetical protein [Mycoplasmoidaceae bacterium]